MSLLAPWFLLGALAIAGPVLFHLIRRTTRERTPFPSLMFLQSSPPRLTRRSRLENLLLLALRCLVLALLALGFSRPFFRNARPPSADPSAGSRTVLLLDTSASMRRSGLREAARAKASKWIADAGPADRIALLTFDRDVATRISFARWSGAPPGERAALARAALDSIAPGWSSSHLGPALIRAAGEFSDTEVAGPDVRRRIVVIGDLQEGSRLEPLQSFDWPPGVEVVPDPVRPAIPGNAGIHLVAESPDADRNADPAVRVRVVNSPDSRREQYQVGWARAGTPGPLASPVAVYVPPGQARVVALAAPTNATGLDRIELRGDDEPFDNTVHVRPPAPAAIDVLYVGNDAPGDPRQPLFFLRRALPETRRQSVHLATAKSGEPLPAAVLGRARLVVVTSRLPDASMDQLRARVESGTTVLFAPATAADCAWLGRWPGLAGLAASDSKAAGYAMLGELDFRHPLLAPFADPRFADFTRVHYWRLRKLAGPLPDNARVVARFDSGDPAWIDFPLGRGRLVFVASGWAPDDSQFALSSKFVPWLYALLELAGAATAPVPNPVVGDPIALPAGRTGDTAVRRPDGTTTNLPATNARFDGTTEPGIYAIGNGADAREVAVNLDPAETRTAPLGIDELERLGVHVGRLDPMPVVPAVPPVVAEAAEAEGRQKLWRWLIVGTLALLFVETILAGRAAARISNPGVTTP